MKKILNVAIIGCGRVARHHSRSIAKLPHQFNLVATCDLVSERSESLSNEYNIPAYLDYYEMLEKHPEVDLVGIITPSGMHCEHAVSIIENFQKHVVIEKPMVMSLDQGELLKNTAAKHGVKVFPVFQYRFNKAVQRVKQAMESGEMGNLVLGTIRLRWCRPQRYYDRDPWRGTYALDGGACTNQGIHHLDLLRYLCGEVKSVNAKMKTIGVDVEVEDTVVAHLEFESGALGVIEITTAARPDDYESSISCLTDNGLAMVGGWATNELIKFSMNEAEEARCSEIFPDVYGFGHKTIYEGIYNSLVLNDKPAVEFDDAMMTMRLLHSLYYSDEVGENVKFKEIKQSSRLGKPDEEIAKIYRTKNPNK